MQHGQLNVSRNTNRMNLQLGSYKSQQVYRESLTDRVPHNKFFKNQMSDLNPFKSPTESQNLLLSRAISLSRINRNIDEQIIRASLSQELANQIVIKQHLKKLKKEQQIETQRQIVKHNRLLLENQALKERRFLQGFKQEASQVLKLRELKKQQQKQQQNLQKSRIDRQYRSNLEKIQKRILGIEQPQSPNIYPEMHNTNRFQQHSYQKYNPEVRIIPIRSHHKPSYEQSIQLKTKMKQTLLQQIRLNSQKKQNQKIERSKTKFIDDKYKLIDNTITNPIDLKIAKDNPYVSRQSFGSRMSFQSTKTNGQMMGMADRNNLSSKRVNDGSQVPASYLSRQGNNSLSKLHY